MKVELLFLIVLVSLLSISISKKKLHTNILKKGKYNNIYEESDEDDIIDVKSESKDEKNVEPFEEIASFLLRNTKNNEKQYDFTKYRLKEITNAITKLAASQVRFDL